MIKTILWDFDGVILDSMKIKGNGFVELFKDFDKESLDKLYKYHIDNGGVSRFNKIKYFYKEILKSDITEERISILANKFANIVGKKLLNKSNLIDDSFNFIKFNYTKYNFHVVSGAEDNELNNICEYLDLKKYFLTINGSPTKKDILIKNIFDKYNYKKEQTILIGDSMTDYNAAKDNNIEFYGYNNIEFRKSNYIESFENFII